MDVSWWKVSKHVSAAMSKCAEQVPKIPPKWSVLLVTLGKKALTLGYSGPNASDSNLAISNHLKPSQTKFHSSSMPGRSLNMFF